MNSNKRQKTCFGSHSQNRQSFSERICDDLCEVILQYLSLEDKLRLECVSKQFQRTVFKKHYELSICSFRNSYWKCLKLFQYKDIGFDFKELESLLKKCSNIKSIQLFDNDFLYIDYNLFVRLIIKYTNNLEKIFIQCFGLSDVVFKEFQTKFGSKLKTFQSMSTNESLKRLNAFPNLEEVTVKRQLITICEGIPRLSLNKIKKLNAIVFQEDRERLTNRLFDNFPNIRSLNLLFDGEYNKNDLGLIFKHISKLNKLIELKIRSDFGLNDTFFVDSVKQMANNCQKLKSIECDLIVTQENPSNFRRHLDPFRGFKQLKRLKLNLNYRFNDKSNEPHIFIDEVFTFDLFKGLSNITHLTLIFNSYYCFDEKTLTNIDIHLPKLQCLRFLGIMNTTSEGTTRLTDILSRLSKLETIEIKSHNQQFCQQIREEITEKCRKIKTIEIKTN